MEFLAGYEVFIGKSLSEEPGWLDLQSNTTEMCFIVCYSEKHVYRGYILIYSEEA